MHKPVICLTNLNHFVAAKYLLCWPPLDQVLPCADHRAHRAMMFGQLCCHNPENNYIFMDNHVKGLG